MRKGWFAVAGSARAGAGGVGWRRDDGERKYRDGLGWAGKVSYGGQSYTTHDGVGVPRG